MFYPNVIETIGRTTRGYDLPTKLLKDRIIYYCGDVNTEAANYTIMQMLWLDADNPDKPIDFYINSPGGSVYEGYAIKDIMDKLNCKVNTIGVGCCASMGAYLLAAGTGERKATKNARIMLHSVSSGTYGTYHDMKVSLDETQFVQDRIMQDLADFSKGKMSVEEAKNLTERDFFMSPNKAIELGIIDKIA